MAASIRQSSGATAAIVTTAGGSISLPGAPVAGNKLVYCQAGDKNTGALTLAGFTEVYSLLSTSVSLYLWEKVSDGTETTISPSWPTAGSGSELWYAEIEDTAVSGSTWQISAQASHITDEVATATWSTGTTGTISSAGLGIALSGVDTANNVGTASWSNSYTAVAAAAPHSGAGGLSVATKSEASGGTTNSTFTFTTADQCSAAIAVFTKVASGGSGPALNANVSHPVNTLFRLRFEVQETGGVAVASAFQLRFSRNGGAYTQVTTATDVRPAASAQFADGAATTDLLPSGTGTFVAGIGEEADAVTPSISLGASGHTEIEYALTIFTGTVGDTFAFRVYKNDGTALDSYAVTPQITVAAAGGAVYTKAAALVGGSVMRSADVFEAGETGSLRPGAVALAADSFEASETGSFRPGSVIRAADVFEATETGSVRAGALLSGSRSHEISEAGSVRPGTFTRGADVGEFAESAALLVGGLLAGTSAIPAPGRTGSLIGGTVTRAADSFEATETGAVSPAVRALAADTFEASETGSLVAGTLTRGASQSGFVARAGALVAGVIARAADVFEASETGALSARTVALAADVFEATETGSVRPAARATGADVAEIGRTGAVASGARVTGADSFEATETGSLRAGSLNRGSAQAGFISKVGALVAGTVTRAADEFTASRTGALIARAATVAADVFEAVESGALRVGVRLTGSSFRQSPQTYEKTGALSAGARLGGESVRESAIPVRAIEGSTFTLASVEGSTTTGGIVEGSTASVGGIE